jgi:hypothetical protein
MLDAGPGRIAGFVEGLPAAQLVTPAEPGEWSARDVLAHMKSCSDMWGGYIVRILREDRPTIKAVNPRTWIRQTDYLEQEFQPLLEAFTSQRAELVAVLNPLGPEAWDRRATVTGAGKPLELTVYSYAERLAVHERPHLKQIRRIAEALRRAGGWEA